MTFPVDNVEETFVASNVITVIQTKHVEIIYKYVNEYVEDGIMNIVLMKSVENESDILTENLSG